MYTLINFNHLVDNDLALLFEKGNDLAFNTIFARYNEFLTLYIMKFCSCNKETAEDLAQETFLKTSCALRKGQYRGENFKGWLFTIAKNTTSRYFSKLKLKLTLRSDFSNTEYPCFSTPEVIFLEKEKFELLYRDIDSLPKDNSKLLRLRLENFSFVQIKKMTGMNENTIKAIIYRFADRYKIAN